MYGNQQTEQHAESEAGERQFVRQQLGFGVGEDEAEYKESEDAIFQSCEGEAEIGVTNNEESAGQQFNEQITRRDFRFTIAAAAAKDKPTDYRQVVVKGDWPLAARTGGAGLDHG